MKNITDIVHHISEWNGLTGFITVNGQRWEVKWLGWKKSLFTPELYGSWEATSPDKHKSILSCSKACTRTTATSNVMITEESGAECCDAFMELMERVSNYLSFELKRRTRLSESICFVCGATRPDGKRCSNCVPAEQME
jgi:hypothetical protein